MREKANHRTGKNTDCDTGALCLSLESIRPTIFLLSLFECLTYVLKRLINMGSG